jgi:hypothetical protein
LSIHLLRNQPHILVVQTDNLLEGPWFALSSMSVGTWFWWRYPDERDCLAVVKSRPAMLYSSLVVTFSAL